MNLLRLSLLTVIITAFVGLNAYALELPPQNNYPTDNNEYVKTVGLDDLVPYSQKDNNTLDVEWSVLDSLGNSYSYFYLLTNKAFVYDKISEKYITIKRGFYQTGEAPQDDFDNSKNNVFIRYSDDLGKTWSDAVLVYDHRNTGFGEGRYPSCYGFEYEGEFSVGFCIPLVDEAAGVWFGHAWGFWNEPYGSFSLHDESIEVGDNLFEWSTDNRLYCEGMGSDFLFQSVSEINPPEGFGTVSNANNIAYRRSITLDDPEKVVPDAWASSVFREVETPETGRFNQQVDFGPGPEDDQLYLAVYGNFVNEIPSKNKPGVSFSTDNGETWGDFDVLPNSVTEAYAIGEFNITSENPADSIIFDWATKSFVMLPNGDFSYIMKALILDYGDRYTKIIQVYNEGGFWGIRTIGDHTGAYIVYADVTNNLGERVNPSDIELQAAVSFDGSKIVAKWVDLIGYDPEMGDFETTDVFVSTLNVGSNQWSEKQNITNSEEIDRSVMLPNFVPNDLMDIPLLKMYSIIYTDDPEDIRAAQFNAGDPQHLMIGHFDAMVGVEDNAENNFGIKSLYPNPANENATILFTTDSYGSCTVEIYDVMGIKLQENVITDHSGGDRYLTIDTSDLPTGSYYVTLRYNGQSQTEVLNVIR